MELKADQVEISTISDAMHKHNGEGGGSPEVANYYSDPAREQRLNLLLHLIHYADLLVLASPEGSGKTTLLSRFSERMGDDWQIHQLQGAALAQETSLSNRFADIFGSAGDGHDDRVQHLINHIPRLRRLSKPIIIIIDEAEKLTLASMQLIDKLLAAGDNYGKPVHIVLAGNPELDDILASPELSGMQERVAHRLDIPPLSETHSAEFINNFIQQTAPDKQDLFNSAVLKKIYRHAEGQPGPIIESIKEVLAEHSAPKAKNKRAKDPASFPLADALNDNNKNSSQLKLLQSRPLIFGAIALGVALAVIGLLRLGGDEEINIASDQAEPESITEPSPTPPPSIPTVESEPDRSVVNALINSTTPISNEPEAAQRPIEEVLPPAEQDVIETVEVAADQTPSATEVPTVVSADPQGSEVATTAQVVEQEPVPIEEVVPQPAAVAPVVEAVAEAPVEQQLSPSADKVQATDVAGDLAPEEEVVEQEQKPVQATNDNGIKREAWLLQQDPNHFTLQLMAANNEPGVIKFINDSGIGASSAYFFSRRDGNPWYAVTYGSYSSRAEANAVQLPASLRGVKPWVRSFGGIHNAIRANP